MKASDWSTPHLELAPLDGVRQGSHVPLIENDIVPLFKFPKSRYIYLPDLQRKSVVNLTDWICSELLTQCPDYRT